MIDIKKTLSLLGIKKSNNGTSTGAISFGSGDEIESFSPVDGTVVSNIGVSTLGNDIFYLQINHQN